MLKFAHFNFNVLDLEKSLAFIKRRWESFLSGKRKQRTALLSWYILAMGRQIFNWN